MVKRSETGRPKRRGIVSVFLLIGVVMSVMAVPAEIQGAAIRYGVHVASFKDISGAHTTIESLKREEGCRPFYVTIDIPGKGMWYRVFACASDNRDDAETCGTRLKSRGMIDGYAVLEIEEAAVPEKNLAAPEMSVTAVNQGSPKKEVAVPLPEPETSDKQITANVAEKKQSADPITREADGDFESGRYESALDRYRSVLQRKDLSPRLKETVETSIADCYFHMGIKGDEQALFKAMEHYRGVITAYGDNSENDAVARLRLAQCYEHLSMNYEAIAELRNLRAKHPDSSSQREATRLLGIIYFKQKSYREAAEEFERYVKRYPGTSDMKELYFTIGDCYSRMNEFSTADRWYREALKRWPDPESMSRNDLMRLGDHYFRAGHYEQAIETLYVLLNLYPDHEETARVMVSIGRSYMGKGDVSTGLKMLGLVIERYPRTDQAHESAIAMANTGISVPGIILPHHIFSGMASYDQPLKTYDVAAAQSFDESDKEEIIFRKSRAMEAKDRYEEAFNGYVDLLKRFPTGRKTKESRERLNAVGKILVERSYEKKDYLSVADLYSRSRRNGLFEYGDFSLFSKIGESLKKIGLLADAQTVFGEMEGMNLSNPERANIILAMAEIAFDSRQYDEAARRAQTVLDDSKLFGRPHLQKAREIMGDISYRKKMYDDAARFYSSVIDAGVTDGGIHRLYKKYADVLKDRGFYPSAIVNYTRALNGGKTVTGDKGSIFAGSHAGLAECYFHEGRYGKSVDMYTKALAEDAGEADSIWNLYWLGRGHMNCGNGADAEHIFTSLREKQQNEFWAALTDYGLDAKFWSDLYHRYGKN
ncbi:MAG: tetratricopeptide repeat protein [Deltaproteobacteria bacterium]|nr:tetratricopeptide repeat protein [Deltaproteobacteria bacterium]